LISEGVLSRTHKIIGLDTSQGMVDVYNRKAANNQVSEKMHAICSDITSLPMEEIPPELQNVDIVVCSMAYHHIENLHHTTKVLASLLKKGGYLIIVDLFQSLSFKM
jgi:SAM-dependent methyltransferase